MKRTTLFITSLVLIVGCSQEPINYETTLVERDGVYFTIDTNKPFSGPVFSLFEDGKKKEEEGTFNDGIKDGLWTYWYEEGQKQKELNYNDGEWDGVMSSPGSPT